MFKDKSVEKEYYQNRLKAKQEFLKKLKDVPCHDCKGKFPYYIMEFDHVPERGEKLFNISTGGNLSTTKGSVLLKELEKCDIVCANCHKIRTHERKMLPT